MFNRVAYKIQFKIERFLLRGAGHQLFFIAFLIFMVAFVGGIIVFIGTESFSTIFEAIWWGFLRLSDPGYLGDDEGLLLRIVSTAITVLGYVLFMGALVAIMTQWLNSKMKKFESGVSEITLENHILILGWTNRTKIIVKELLVSQGRVSRFLKRIGENKLKVVILVEELDSNLVYELKDELGEFWDSNKLILRSGNHIRIEHLRRVDFSNASVIIIPGGDFLKEETRSADRDTIKTLLTISNSEEIQDKETLPIIVAELIDYKKEKIAKSAYKGELEIVSSNKLISRLIAQNVRHKGLSDIYNELLTHSQGNEIYLRDIPEFEGKLFAHIWNKCPNGIIMGILREENGTIKPYLNPTGKLTVKANDKFVIMSENYDKTIIQNKINSDAKERAQKNWEKENLGHKNILILGWSKKVITLLEEFNSYVNESFRVVILSLLPKEKRIERIERYIANQNNLEIINIEGSYSNSVDLEKLDLTSFNNIVLLSSDWIDDEEEEADARTIMGYLVLRELLSNLEKKPDLLIELMDPENEKLFEKYGNEIVLSPLLLSHIIAQISLRKELQVIYYELFSTGGAEIYLRECQYYGIKDAKLKFSEIEKKIFEHGDIALGVGKTKSNSEIKLNPNKNEMFELKSDDKLIVLTTY